MYFSMKMMYNDITLDDYTFADNGFNDLWAVKLKTKYEGVVYCYGKVTAQVADIDKETGDAMANLKFQYQILDPGDHDQEALEADKDFNDYIGDVLNHILQDAFENDKYRIGDDDTNNSTEESTNQ
jgi:hypothetical protein